jgi:hypothetical protein
MGQVRCWADDGHDVYLVLYRAGKILKIDTYGRGGLDFRSSLQAPTSRVGKLLQIRDRYRLLGEFLADLKPDLTYSRYLFPAPGLQRALRQAGKFVLEINSNDLSELYLRHFSTGVINQLCRARLFARSDGCVFVTHELADQDAFSECPADRVVIGNGIDPDQVPFVENPGNSQPQVVFVGSPGQSWQGVDKLRLIAQVLDDCVLHVIGPAEAECLAAWGQVPSNVRVYGYLDGPSVSDVLSKMDVGLATLALHRKAMGEACPLKARQYLAYGIPMVAAYRDTDIVDAPPFVLTLPNEEDNILPFAKQISDYVHRVFGDVEVRKAARDFAESRLSEVTKEGDRLAFFEAIVGS